MNCNWTVRPARSLWRGSSRGMPTDFIFSPDETQRGQADIVQVAYLFSSKIGRKGKKYGLPRCSRTIRRRSPLTCRCCCSRRRLEVPLAGLQKCRPAGCVGVATIVQPEGDMAGDRLCVRGRHPGGDKVLLTRQALNRPGAPTGKEFAAGTILFRDGDIFRQQVVLISSRWRISQESPV